MSIKLKETLSLFVLFSLVLHLFFYFGIDNFKKMSNSVEKDQPTLIELDVRSLESESKTRQIVDQDEKKLNDEIDEEAKYLGRHNQKVIKETKAAHSGAFSNAAQPGQRKAGSPEPTPDKNQKSKLSGDLPSLDKLKPQFSMTPKAENYDVQQEGLNSQTPDHLKDVDRGIQTMLSTREFVYFSYYQRIREKIRQQWEPRIRKKVHQVFASGRTIASSRDRITQVIIVLDKSGSLENVQVVGESGVQDLDEAAVEAFKAAEPFPNPPAGIVEADGKIRIRWDFVLEAQFQNEVKPIKNARVANEQTL